MPDPEETSSNAAESGQNADKAWFAKPFNKGFAFFVIGAVIVVALIMAYYLLFAVKQASPGVKSALPEPAQQQFARAAGAKSEGAERSTPTLGTPASS